MNHLIHLIIKHYLKQGSPITNYYKKENNIILVKGISNENIIYLAKIVLV